MKIKDNELGRTLELSEYTLEEREASKLTCCCAHEPVELIAAEAK